MSEKIKFNHTVLQNVSHVFGMMFQLAVILASFSCSDDDISSDSSMEKGDTMYQVSTLQSLLDGGYDGLITIGELKKYGDTGVGTFDKIDGEMIVLDDTIYQARYDGSVCVADDSITVPFANITRFDEDFSVTLSRVGSMDELTRQLTEAITPYGLAQIYTVRIDVPRCDSIHVRSELPQQKPYRPLAEVLQSDQREFNYGNMSGTIVALYFPQFFDKQNSTGWHCHFVSQDRTKGGHMFNITTDTELTAHIDITPYFLLNMKDGK